MINFPENTPDWVKSPSKGRKAVYPFATMAVGELHRVPKADQTCTYSSFRSLTYTRGQQLGRKFYTRVNPEDGAFELFRGE